MLIQKKETENTPSQHTVTSESITDSNIDSIEAPMSSETFTGLDTNPKPIITPDGSLNSSHLPIILPLFLHLLLTILKLL